MLTVGEVRTGLLQNSQPVRSDVAAELLALLPGARVRTGTRPIQLAVSPDVLTGVDCRLATRTGARPRAVGTVQSRATLTGGRVLQGSSVTRLAPASADRRLPWSHYLSRPGVAEVVGRVDWPAVADGLLAAPAGPDTLDLAAISDRVIDRVQRNTELDRRPPLRASRTTLRWVIDRRPGSGTRFTVVNASLRTLRLTIPEPDPVAVAALCEDIALHDWMLSTLSRLVEDTRPGSGPEFVARLRPVVDHLLHLWLPGSRVAETLLPIWNGLEQHPGFTRQWNLLVNRLRDQIAVTTVTLLDAAARRLQGGTDGSA
jgi:hypothetical protein